MKVSLWLLLSLAAPGATASQFQQADGNDVLKSTSASAHEVLDELRGLRHDVKIKTHRTRSVTERVWSLMFGKISNSLTSQQRPEDLSIPVQKLQKAADEGDADALFLLAEMSFHGNFTYTRNYHDALKYYSLLAELTGNMTAHEQIAVLYSTGINGVENDQGLALLHHSFAAEQGSIRSQMALGFRYLNGIGTPRNCSIACGHYATAATSAMNWIRSGPPGGMYFNVRAFRFSEEHGGLYGSAPPRYSFSSDASSVDDIIDYYTYLAERADLQASFSLAKLYNEGSRTVEQDWSKGLYWFRQVAKSYWTKDGKVVKNAKLLKIHAKSAGYIGIAYLRGEGADQDFEKAKMWFLRGVALGESISQNGYGLMHLSGLGSVQKDLTKAEELFKAAADNENRAAQINLGKVLAAKGDMTAAGRLFEAAARSGRIEAFYYLAQFHEHGIGRERNCAMATQYYKIVSESVETLHSTIPYGIEAYQQGNMEDAIISNIIAAESGYEVGQINVAFLLDKHSRVFSARSIIRHGLHPLLEKFRSLFPYFQVAESGINSQPSSELSDELALRYYSRSATQQNFEALVKAGDFHLQGYGTALNEEKAVELWSAAAETRMVPLALWNLGWSYENGIGVEQDYHLAKRYYDACLETDKRAYLPVSLSLLKLRARSAWNTVTGGSVNSIRDEDAKLAEASWSSIFTGLKHFWRSQFDYSNFNNDGDGDSQERFVDEDYPSVEDDLYETLIILGICLLVGFAVYMRTTWTQTRRNQGAGQVNVPAQDPNPHIAEWIVSALFARMILTNISGWSRNITIHND